ARAAATGRQIAGWFSACRPRRPARRSGGGSVWGARLDPLTDKLLICAPLLWLASQGRLPLVAVWLLLARELLISGWRAQQGSGGPASWGGKLKTILQFVSLLLLLWPVAWPFHALAWGAGWWLFWPGFVLALTSALGYIRDAR
ncbi:MAG: CDP-alcohol phosphatidyltransferase family protein, partial [Cyanobium sp.]